MTKPSGDALYARSKMKTVPQIFHGDALVGGFSELTDLDKKDQLNSLKEVSGAHEDLP